LVKNELKRMLKEAAAFCFNVICLDRLGKTTKNLRIIVLRAKIFGRNQRINLKYLDNGDYEVWCVLECGAVQSAARHSHSGGV
jgi:hypothetical protein